METVIGKVEHIKFQDPNSNFKIFTIRQKDKSCITVQAEVPNLLMGAVVEAHGDYKSHPKYGTSFRAQSFAFSHDKSKNGLVLFLQSIAKWIGPERAYRIAEHFEGKDLDHIIYHEPEKLLELDGIGESIVKSLVEAWKENKELKDVKIFLHSLGLSPYKINKIVSRYSYNAEMVIKQNPFLLSFEGFGFSTCDFLANKLGMSPQDPLRYRYFILYTLKGCLQSGHLFLNGAELIAIFNEYNKLTQQPFSPTSVKFEDIETHLAKLIQDGFIYQDGDRYYELSSFFYENESARLINKILESKDICNFTGFDAEEFIRKYELSNKINLSAEQKDAIFSFVNNKITILTGGPGTGKTQTTKAFVEIMKQKNISFELLTPTGISAKKLASTTGTEAYTIHRRLGYKGEEWSYNALNKYSTQVIILDEISMVDQEVFYRLISSLYSHTKLVFVGDNDQLPSVGPGSVLRELIECGSIHTVRLTQIFRQEEQSDIIKAAKKIRDGDTDLSLFKSEKGSDIWFIRDSNLDRIEKTIVDFAKNIKEMNKTKDQPTLFQIITPRNSGPLSVDSLNTALQAVLNPPGSEKELHLLSGTIRRGDRVIIKKNNYDLDVYNGDIGKVANITSTEAVIEIDDFNGSRRRVDIPIKIADDMLKLAYSISCHKSQGQEYPLVILPIVKAHGSKILQRNLLYTAITRAKKKVFVIGQGSALIDAIENDRIQKRNTLFGQRINQWMKKEGTSLRTLYSNAEAYQNVENLKQLLSLETANS